MTRDPKPMMATGLGPGTGLDGYATDFNGQQHVNFIGDDGDVHELVYTDHWMDNDLSQVADPPNIGYTRPREGSLIAGYATEFNKQQHVNYIDYDLHVHELVYTDHWAHNDLTAAANAHGYPPVGDGPLDGYATEFNKQQHVNYISTDSHVHELVYTDHWEHIDLSEAAGALGSYLPGTASPLVGYATEFNSQQHVIYRGQDGDLHELVYKGDWYHTDLIVAANAQFFPPIEGSPIAAYATEFNKQQHVNYIGIDLHVHELVYTDHWAYNDLTAAANAQNFPPIESGPIAAYATEFNNQQHVIYLGQDGDVHELVYKDDWSHTDLTVAAGALGYPPATPGLLVGYATEFNGQQHVIYLGQDGDLHELVYTDHWSPNDLTQIAV